MPKKWLYFVALFLPLTVSLLVLYTSFIDWLWYNGHQDAWEIFSRLKLQPLFLQFVGGWPLPIFTVTVFCYWLMDDDEEGIAAQFMMLPIAYLPFTIVGDVLVTGEFHRQNLYVHPLIVVPLGYMYIFAWAFFIWAMDKLRLVM